MSMLHPTQALHCGHDNTATLCCINSDNGNVKYFNNIIS